MKITFDEEGISIPTEDSKNVGDEEEIVNQTKFVGIATAEESDDGNDDAPESVQLTTAKKQILDQRKSERDASRR